jgi:hypothetical protein
MKRSRGNRNRRTKGRKGRIMYRISRLMAVMRMGCLKMMNRKGIKLSYHHNPPPPPQSLDPNPKSTNRK